MSALSSLIQTVTPTSTAELDWVKSRMTSVSIARHNLAAGISAIGSIMVKLAGEEELSHSEAYGLGWLLEELGDTLLELENMGTAASDRRRALEAGARPLELQGGEA